MPTTPRSYERRSMKERVVRRMAGLLRARLPELALDEVPDPRAREGRWTLAQILRATLLGLMAGCKSLSETETLTAHLAPAMRRRLGLPRRLSSERVVVSRVVVSRVMAQPAAPSTALPRPAPPLPRRSVQR